MTEAPVTWGSEAGDWISLDSVCGAERNALCTKLVPWATEHQCNAAVHASHGGRTFVRADGSEIRAYPCKQKSNASFLDRSGFTRAGRTRDGLLYTLERPPPPPSPEEQRRYTIVFHGEPGVSRDWDASDLVGADRWRAAVRHAAIWSVDPSDYDRAVVSEFDGNGRMLRSVTVRVTIEET